ncbi:hypothetical protein ACROYT_G014161 [Oculina patagonica]
MSSLPPTAQSNINQVCVQPPQKVHLQVLSVQIHSQGNLVNTYAVLDPGSDSTLIRKDLADCLQIVGEACRLYINTVGNDVTTQNLHRVSSGFSSKVQPDPFMVHGTWVIDKLNIPSFKFSKKRVVEQWNHLSDVDLPELEEHRRPREPLSSLPPTAQSNINQVCVQPPQKVHLQDLSVQIHSQGNLVNTYAVLDPGSDSTLIRKDLADCLQIVGEACRLYINTVGNDVTTQNLHRVSSGFSSKVQPDPFMVHGTWVIDKLNIPSFKFSKKRVVEQWNHLSDVDLPELEGGDVMILIGSDMAHLLIHLEVR